MSSPRQILPVGYSRIINFRYHWSFPTHPGSYMVRIRSAESVIVRKVLLEHENRFREFPCMHCSSLSKLDCMTGQKNMYLGKMKRIYFDVIVIVVLTLALVILNQLDLLGQSAKYMFIPVLAFYFLGQYAERKFRK